MPSGDDPWDDAAPLPPKPQDWSGPSLGPIFTATYETDCESCSDPILPGEDARADGGGGWIHADDECERIASPRPVRTNRTAICPACFTVHKGECL